MANYVLRRQVDEILAKMGEVGPQDAQVIIDMNSKKPKVVARVPRDKRPLAVHLKAILKDTWMVFGTMCLIIAGFFAVCALISADIELFHHGLWWLGVPLIMFEASLGAATAWHFLAREMKRDRD